MSHISVEIWDTTGSKRQVVEVPADAPVNRFVAVLVERLNLPQRSPDGQPMSYKLHHRASGRQLLETDTLASAGVGNGDIMRLQPEITAGATRINMNPVAAEGRFSRFELIAWWDQARLRRARIVVIGAGALGNEIVKNLALLGVGRVFIADMDTVEESNLSRSILFRARDQGKGKAVVAAEAARDICPETRVQPWVGNVVHDLGLGVFLWADIIIGGLDNREARVAINSFAARCGKVWVDGAIERLDGVARVFDPSAGPCYECTMSDADWRVLAARRSCALLTREEMAGGKVPTTPTTSSVIAGIQCQEVVKYLHGLDTLIGRGFVFTGTTHESYVVTYPPKPDCPVHERYEQIIAMERGSADVTAGELLQRARADLGADAVLDLGRDLIAGLACANCSRTDEVGGSLGKVTEAEGVCPRCGGMRAPITFCTISGDEAFLDRTLADLGVPPWEVVAARGSGGALAYELTGDREGVLGVLAAEDAE